MESNYILSRKYRDAKTKEIIEFNDYCQGVPICEEHRCENCLGECTSERYKYQYECMSTLLSLKIIEDVTDYEINNQHLNECEMISLPKELANDIYNELVCCRRLRETYDDSGFKEEHIKHTRHLYKELDKHMNK